MLVEDSLIAMELPHTNEHELHLIEDSSGLLANGSRDEDKNTEEADN